MIFVIRCSCFSVCVTVTVTVTVTITIVTVTVLFLYTYRLYYVHVCNVTLYSRLYISIILYKIDIGEEKV